jgi:hypothetical protein
VIIVSHGKVVIYICEISASAGPIYMTKNEYGVLVECSLTEKVWAGLIGGKAMLVRLVPCFESELRLRGEI